ncbi:MAG: HAD family phosphatase [Comamonadaceae bacterium]|nr:MAG: HAD family phosphatase [Comamonadaceae bacterium]
MSAVPVRAVLFDIGNVLIEVDFARVLAAWQPASRLAAADLQRAFGFDLPYQQHETGALGPAGYFDHLRTQLQLDCADEHIQAGWNAIFGRPIEPTLACIDALDARIGRHAFSNTNAVHLAQMQRAFPEVLARFGHVFVSHVIGHRKPQPAAFRHVLDTLGLDAGEILFFDDTPENVEGARRCGIASVLVREPQDVRRGLVDAGLLPVD